MIFQTPVASTKSRYIEGELPPPIRGLNAVDMLMGMKSTDALIMDNFRPLPDSLETRPGYVEHVTGFTEIPRRLHTYSNMTGADSLWATTDGGIYNVTSAGAVGTAAIALTEGKTVSTALSTGANSYLFVVNGVDSMKRYDGSSWTSVATLGATSTSGYSYVETYRQRLFFAKKQSLTIEYLPVNSISGTPIVYELGAIFRMGGSITALGTWTLDSGTGPDDLLAVMTSEGEVAVFSGTDPSSYATWALKGVFFIGRPLGYTPLYKYGGDILVLAENGLYPLSKALQSTAIERTFAVSERIRQLFSNAASEFYLQEGWQVITDPAWPMVLVNIPASPVRKQFVMHAQTGSWATFSGWEAYAFARMGTELYFSTATGVMRIAGASDNGTNITATLLTAYSKFASGGRESLTKLVRPYFSGSGAYAFTLGIAADLSDVQDTTTPTSQAFQNPGLWGTAIWGTAVWGGTTDFSSDWYTVPDSYSKWKALYLQIVSNQSVTQYLGADIRAV